MNVYRVMIGLASTLAACTSNPVTTAELAKPSAVFNADLWADAPGKGSVIVKRDSGGPLGPRNCTQAIAIDGQKALMLQYAEGTTLYLNPGEHVVTLTFPSWLCDTGDSELAVRVDAAKQKVLRSVTRANSVTSLQQSSR